MTSLVRYLHVLFIFILSAVLLGAFSVQLFLQEEPCPLCLLQRMGMIGIASGVALNLKFGIKPLHYGIILLFCLFGAGIAFRQIDLHICPGFPVFGKPIFGLNLYTWSFLVHISSVLGVTLLLSLFKQNQSEKRPMNALETFSVLLILSIALLNVVLTLMECGFGVCKG